MPGPADARHRGARIERAAADWLATEHGMSLVARNHHARGGELDLIMRDGETLVFVEVKHRADSRHGHPLESVTPVKRRRLVHAAHLYLQRNRLSCPCRFDVVAVTGSPPELEFLWVPAAFDAF